MRLSIFAGLPLGLIALTAGYEIALRYASYEGALVLAILSLLFTLVILHQWDQRRFRKLLNPPAKKYPVDCDAARLYLIQTLLQVQYEDAEGFRSGWKISEPQDKPDTLSGKIVIRTRAIGLNIVAWVSDSIDRVYKPRTILMDIRLSRTDNGTLVRTTYKFDPMFDWSRCADLIKQTNGWIDESLSRIALERMVD